MTKTHCQTLSSTVGFQFFSTASPGPYLWVTDHLICPGRLLCRPGVSWKGRRKSAWGRSFGVKMKWIVYPCPFSLSLPFCTPPMFSLMQGRAVLPRSWRVTDPHQGWSTTRSWHLGSAGLTNTIRALETSESLVAGTTLACFSAELWKKLWSVSWGIRIWTFLWCLTQSGSCKIHWDLQGAWEGLGSECPFSKVGSWEIMHVWLKSRKNQIWLQSCQGSWTVKALGKSVNTRLLCCPALGHQTHRWQCK